jgi:hypothetical protein
MNNTEQFLAGLGKAAEPRRPFDTAAGLRRLAEDSGYARPTKEPSPTSRARRQLAVVARWTLSLPTAAIHVARLADEIGDAGPGDARDPGRDLDVDGVQAFAAMLHLADHDESAQFWWQLAAGADNPIAVYCLHLLHLSRGETREAALWQHQLLHHADDDFLHGLDQFARHIDHHEPPGSPAISGLEAEFDRLANHHRQGSPVFLPAHELANRIQRFALWN